MNIRVYESVSHHPSGDVIFVEFWLIYAQI